MGTLIRYSSSLVFILSFLFASGCQENQENKNHSPDGRLLEQHFGLPYMDLARDTSRQFIVARQDGIYYGHPTTVRVFPNGEGETILASFPTGGHAKGVTSIRRSVDGGKTWSNDIPSASDLGNIKEVPTIHKVRDASGKERLIMFTGLYPVRMSVSEDHGETWAPYQPIGDWGGIVTMSDLIPIKEIPTNSEFAAGKYKAFFHDDGRFIREGSRLYEPGKFILYQTLSEDGGLSWSYPEVIWEDTLKFICEPGLIRSPDGQELAMLLRENSRRYNSQIMFSRDEGKSWTDPRPMPAALCGDRHVLRYGLDGRIVAVFRDRQPATAKGPTEGDYVAWIGTYEDLVNGSKGQYRVRLLKNYKGYDCGYSGLEVLEDGTFLATTYLQYRIEDGGFNSVVSVRFRLEELDQILEKLRESG